MRRDAVVQGVRRARRAGGERVDREGEAVATREVDERLRGALAEGLRAEDERVARMRERRREDLGGGRRLLGDEDEDGEIWGDMGRCGEIWGDSACWLTSTMTGTPQPKDPLPRAPPAVPSGKAGRPPPRRHEPRGEARWYQRRRKERTYRQFNQRLVYHSGTRERPGGGKERTVRREPRRLFWRERTWAPVGEGSKRFLGGRERPWAPAL